MEGRRVEGILLDVSILRNKAFEAYEASRAYEIRILSRVPEALLASFGDVGSRVRANVMGMEGGKVLLMLENGYEIEADNRLAIPVSEGEELTLVVESKNPLTLKVESTFSGLKGLDAVLKRILSSPLSLVKGDSLDKEILNSGLFYEKKVWNFIRGFLTRDLLEADEKYRVLNTLTQVDSKDLEEFLKNVHPPQELRESFEELTGLLREGKKAEFFLKFIEVRNELPRILSRKATELTGLKETVRSVFRDLVNSLVLKLRRMNIVVSVDEKVLKNMEDSPKSLDVLRGALRSLEEGKLQEFTQRLRLTGIEIKNPELLPFHTENLKKSLRSLIEGAVRSLSSKLDVSDVQELSKVIKDLSEDLERLKGLDTKLSDLPKHVKEDVAKFELITYLQSFLIMTNGRSFILPFGEKDHKGLLGFSLKDVYRIFLRVNLKEGYLGAVIESPRKDRPDRIEVLFSTDREDVARILEGNLEKLKGELESLDLKVSRIEVRIRSTEEFDTETGNLLGEEGIFNLRV